MDSALIFIVVLLAFAAGYIWWAFRSVSEAKQYLTKTREGLGILKGIVLFTLFGIVIAGMSFATRAEAQVYEPEGQWFSYAEVYLGLDWTKADPSPQCYPEGADSRGTSNGGLRLNLYESGDSRFHSNLKYTHHSCALNKDRNHYDALGFEFVYRFYSR